MADPGTATRWPMEGRTHQTTAASAAPGREVGRSPHVLSGMIWVFNSGARWRDWPECYGEWQTVLSPAKAKEEPSAARRPGRQPQGITRFGSTKPVSDREVQPHQ